MKKKEDTPIVTFLKKNIKHNIDKIIPYTFHKHRNDDLSSHQSMSLSMEHHDCICIRTSLDESAVTMETDFRAILDLKNWVRGRIRGMTSIMCSSWLIWILGFVGVASKNEEEDVFFVFVQFILEIYFLQFN